MRLLLTALAVMFMMSPAHAGSPVEREVTCPIGGEVFTVIRTRSCSSFGQRSMSFRPLTSCDFITRLPVCPGNGLPMYKEFSAAELADLTAFLATDTYVQLRPLSPHLRAYALESHLGKADTKISFGLILAALWYESKDFAKPPDPINILLREAGAERARAPATERPYIQAIVAYALGYTGHTDAARAKLTELGTADVPKGLRSYLSALEACLRDFSAAECRPDAAMPR